MVELVILDLITKNLPLIAGPNGSDRTSVTQKFLHHEELQPQGKKRQVWSRRRKNVAALDVLSERSNFARKNGALLRLNAFKSELGNGKDFLIFD